MVIACFTDEGRSKKFQVWWLRKTETSFRILFLNLFPSVLPFTRLIKALERCLFFRAALCQAGSGMIANDENTRPDADAAKDVEMACQHTTRIPKVKAN